MRDTSFILLGAGKGERIGKPKIFLRIEGKPLYLYLIEKLENIKFIGETILACPPKFKSEIKNEIKNRKFKFNVKIIEGGKTRCESMEKAVKKAKFEYVFIHDLARPFFSTSLILNMKKKLKKAEIVVPYFSPYDTCVYEGEKIQREKVKLIHTPQATKKSLILKALKKTKRRNYSDESTLLKDVLNINPLYIEDSFLNFKITYNKDLFDINYFLNHFSFRIGFGFDIHRIVKGKKSLFVGGIAIKRGIYAVGHSDGDAVIHSLCDALLGITGRGDIGDFFPDTENRWKGKRSVIFLKKIFKIFKGDGFEISNIDITILLDTPKLGEKKRKIKEKIAKVLRIKPEVISIKAKTTEGLFKDFIFAYTILTAKSSCKIQT
ncbi:MAG: 2-C-methyl-D-erythritol 2,4-cyclodiphosphate synthase [Candidatus Hydrothermales bacterium]